MIEIVSKPDAVSWDEISRVVYLSHAKNRENGLDIRNANLTGKEIEERLGNEGKCFIARKTSDGTIIATASVAFHKLDRWYAHGLFAYLTLEAVLPEWSGQHIFSLLSLERMKHVNSLHCDGTYMYVAEGNTLRRHIANKEGFISVAIDRTEYNRHNYLTYVKWLGNKPHSLFYIRTRYVFNWIKLKLKNCLLLIFLIKQKS